MVMYPSKFRRFFRRFGIGDEDIAKELGIHFTTVSKKIRGLRGWKKTELEGLRGMLAKRGVEITVQEIAKAVMGPDVEEWMVFRGMPMAEIAKGTGIPIDKVAGVLANGEMPRLDHAVELALFLGTTVRDLWPVVLVVESKYK